MTTQSLFQFGDVSAQVRADDAERYCLGCGYNLRGLSDSRCPECGRAVDVHEYDGLRAPWVERRRIGAMAAYWQTAALVTFRPGDFVGRFHWRRVRFHGSHTFRLWTVGWAAAAVVVAVGALAWHLGGVGATGLAVLAAALAPSAVVFAYGATELAGFFIGPHMPSDTSEELFRARMINDYASAALAWTPVPAAVLLLAVAAGKAADSPADEVLFLLSGALAAWVGVLWLGGALVLFGRALDLGPGALLLSAVIFPVWFAGVAVLTTLFVFAPLACAVGGLISLRA